MSILLLYKPLRRLQRRSQHNGICFIIIRYNSWKVIPVSADRFVTCAFVTSSIVLRAEND